MSVTVYVCGDCKVDALKHGAVEDPEVVEIAYGRSCEVHPSSLQHQATSAVIPPEGWRPSVADDVPVEVEVPSFPSSIGPLTELASRLLVGWTAASEGAKADPAMVNHAVMVARDLLHVTKGA
jgi:hypothetical protein